MNAFVSLSILAAIILAASDGKAAGQFCSVNISSALLQYQKCENLQGRFRVFYSRSDTNRSLDFTYQAISQDGKGWIGFGLAEQAGSMVPALAVLAFPSLEYKPFGFDNGYVRQYSLTSRSSFGARPLRSNPALQSVEAYLDPVTNAITVRLIHPLNVTSNQTWFAIGARGPPVRPTSPMRLSMHNEFYSTILGVEEVLPGPDDGGDSHGGSAGDDTGIDERDTEEFVRSLPARATWICCRVITTRWRESRSMAFVAVSPCF